MDKELEITQELKELQRITTKLSKYLDVHNLSAKMILWDIESIGAKKKALLEEIDQIKSANQSAKVEAAMIVGQAKMEAEEILKAAREKLAAAVSDRELAKEELTQSIKKARETKKAVSA